MRNRDRGAFRSGGLLIALLLTGASLAAQGRLASDFEISQMERQLERARGFEGRISGHLNLGDLRALRNEPALAQEEYVRARALAQEERADARRDSALTRYAIATSYAALAEAKLGRPHVSFLLLEESIRYLSDDAPAWNLYASAMRALGHPAKAVSAARNAVAIAETETATLAKRLDLAVYRYALATMLADAGATDEAVQLLTEVTSALRSGEFARLQREAVRQEAFEIYSSAQGEVAAFVSLLNRAQLRLAALHESRGETARAREQYEAVLQGRSDDVIALTALARLSASERDRERGYEQAFDANPFSPRLVEEYRAWLRSAGVDPRTISGSTHGALMRRALAELAAEDRAAARQTLGSLAAAFPANETIAMLRREAAARRVDALPPPEPSREHLLALVDGFAALTPDQRRTLDDMTFASEVTFDSAETAAEGRTVLARGTLHGIPFRFGGPTTFAGSFAPSTPLRLSYRILGVTREDGRPLLLLEPLRLEVLP